MNAAPGPPTVGDAMGGARGRLSHHAPGVLAVRNRPRCNWTTRATGPPQRSGVPVAAGACCTVGISWPSLLVYRHGVAGVVAGDRYEELAVLLSDPLNGIALVGVRGHDLVARAASAVD